MTLKTQANILEPDQFYEELIAVQRYMDHDSAMAMNARLVLVLANHIGDRAVLREALEAASST